MDKLYNCQINNKYLKITILQYIAGKEYTFTIEEELP